jgi:hypothetical protein
LSVGIAPVKTSEKYRIIGTHVFSAIYYIKTRLQKAEKTKGTQINGFHLNLSLYNISKREEALLSLYDIFEILRII